MRKIRWLQTEAAEKQDKKDENKVEEHKIASRRERGEKIGRERAI